MNRVQSEIFGMYHSGTGSFATLKMTSTRRVNIT